MAITVKHKFVSAIPDGDDATIVRPSNWNDTHELTGLGTLAEQNANNVSITGGSIAGATVSGYIPTSEKAQPLGVATLDAGGKVPASQIPLQGDLNYQGTWNATTNSPTLTSSTGTKGYYYVVDVAGTTNLNGITDWQIGDWAIFNGTVWQKVDNTDAVTSVNGKTGTVVLTNTDISGFGTMSTQNSNNVNITGGSLDNVTIGSFSAGTGDFTTLTATTSNFDSINLKGQMAFSGNAGTAGQVFTSDGAGRIAKWTTPTTGTVTSVAATAGTGISVSGSPITSSGTLTITNTAPDQTVAIAAGTGISTSGTYPNFTVTNTAPDQTVAMTSGTGISVTGTYPNFTVTNTAPSSGGTVTSVGATAPIASTGGNTPTISIATANTTTTGALTSTDWNTFNNKQATLVSGTSIKTVNGTSLLGAGDVPVGVLTVTGTAPVVSSGGATPAISMAAANTTTNGYLTSTDWNTFNGKSNTNGTVTSVAALTIGTTGTDLSSTVATGTTTPVISLQVPTASATNRGALSAADWSTFNSKAPAVTYTTSYVPYGQGTTTPAQSANFTFASSTLTAPIVRASNGIVVNSNTVSASYTIPTGSSAMSAGPMTVASGQTVTVSSGSRWVVL